ncbi:hypothetical protein SDC9_58815 [bioreactor metagenome]|uniref:ABC transporter substrate-binding protein n=1 Tax=bioreactor metagenome TaxID=1076179 RepID=A0A644X8I3_9ZZZZ
MKRTLRLLSLLLSLAMMLSVAACSGSGSAATPAPSSSPSASPSPEAKVYKVGIIQMMDHVALNGAREGFIQALADKGLVDGQNVEIDYKDANADSNNYSTIADQFVMDKKDLVLAIATPAAQAMAAKTTEIPILATAVTSFTAAGLVDSDEVPGGNVSGTTDMNPVDKQMELMFTLCPNVKTVGFLYCSSEDNSRLQVDIAKKWLDAKGIKYVERTVSNQNEVQQATQSIVTECDAIYLPTDNIFAATMPIVNEITVAAGIPTICGEAGMVQNGGFATLGITYYGIGYQAGLMAVDILVNGADISKMPITGSNEFEYCINGDVAKALGITIPTDLQQYVVTPSPAK